MRQADRWRAAVLTGTVLAAPVLAVAGCSAPVVQDGTPAGPTGTVTGTYLRVGGPAGTPSVPLPGTISFVSKNETMTFTADSRGRFTGELLAGSYTASARSSLINSGADPCGGPQTVRVTTSKTVKITITCNIR